MRPDEDEQLAASSLLACVFLLAGGMKLVLPLEQLQGPVELPGPLVRFIGVAEVCGALGLILPGLFRIRQSLTPLAAAGLVVIMIGAVAISLIGDLGVLALIPLLVGTIAALIAYSRWLSASRVRLTRSVGYRLEEI